MPTSTTLNEAFSYFYKFCYFLDPCSCPNSIKVSSSFFFSFFFFLFFFPIVGVKELLSSRAFEQGLCVQEGCFKN